MYQSIDEGTILQAALICEKHNGINRINSWWTNNSSVVCGDSYTKSFIRELKNEPTIN